MTAIEMLNKAYYELRTTIDLLSNENATLRSRVAAIEGVMRSVLPTWQTAVNCSECGGDGEVMEMVCHGDSPSERWETCVHCGGSGVEYWPFGELLKERGVEL